MKRNAKVLLSSLFAAGVALWCQTALAQETTGELTLQQILERAMAISKEREQKNKNLAFLQRVTVEELDDDGKVEEKKEFVIKVIPIGDTRYERLIKKNGKALEGDELEEEQEKEREFREDIKKGKKPKGQEEGSFKFDEKFVGKRIFELKGEEAVNGRMAYKVNFKPKAGDLPEENMTDKFMNKTKGTLWIDKEDFEMSKAHTVLIEPVKVLGGIAANITRMEFTFVAVKNGDEWFPGSMRNRISGRKLLSSFDMNMKATFDSFEKIVP